MTQPAADCPPDRERAETHLRLVVEAELRRATSAEVGPMRAAWIARVLTEAGALDVVLAEEILAGFQLALAVRRPAGRPASGAMRTALARHGAVPLTRSAARAPLFGSRTVSVSASQRRPVPQPEAPDILVPLGMTIPVRDDQTRGELYLLAYAQTAAGALITMTARLHDASRLSRSRRPLAIELLHNLSMTDDQGTSYSLGFSGGGSRNEWSGELRLHPYPSPGIRWLELDAPGGPVRRISLGQSPTPAVTVTESTLSFGDYLLTSIAASILAAGHIPYQPAELGDIIDALLAAGALSPVSPLPGQLAGLCRRAGISDGSIAAWPEQELPERWLSVLTPCPRAPCPHNRARAASPHTRCAGLALALPGIEGARVSILGLRNSPDDTVLHMHVSGIRVDPRFDLGFLPVPWIRDDGGHWHAMSVSGWQLGQDGEGTVQLSVVPPLSRAESIDIVMTGRSAEVRTTVGLQWS